MNRRQGRRKQTKKGSKAGWIVALLLLLGGTGYFTNGFGLLGNGGGQDNSDTADTRDGSRLAPATITVEENHILWNNQEVSNADLKDQLAALGAKGEVKLVDHNAIKATYEAVVAAITEADVTITQSIEE